MAGVLGRRAVAAAVLGAAGLVLVATGTSPSSAATGEVLTFGANTYGQLGNGPVSSIPRPTPTSVLGAASDVAGGREHVLALVGGRVWAWGADTKGAVGNGGGYETAVTTPTELSGLTGVDSVTTGHYHSMALDNDTDTVWAWGWNSRGQAGPAGGTAGKVRAPVEVTGLSGQVSMIAAGRAHSLALADGHVYAWGDNNSGQLALAPDTGRHPTPRLVAGLPDGVTWIAGGRDSSFAVAGGSVYAWGNNTYGQLGIGSTTSQSQPVLVPGITATQVESGADHTVALRSDGTVAAWGRNRYGQVGVPGSRNRTTPVVLASLSGITEVRVGRDHSMAIGEGTLYLWGRNDGGQLGLDPATTPQTSTPTALDAAAGVTDAGGGQVYTVLLR